MIAALIVPCVLGAAILLLYVLQMSFNIMTLGGMAAAVGLIIDDMVVMEEQIVRRLREAAGDHRTRVMAAMREFFQPLSGSSAATIIIFTPMAFLSGVTGAFFKSLSLTMAASLIISFLMAWLAVPLLAAYLLRAEDARQEDNGVWTQRVQSAYDRLMPACWDAAGWCSWGSSRCCSWAGSLLPTWVQALCRKWMKGDLSLIIVPPRALP